MKCWQYVLLCIFQMGLYFSLVAYLIIDLAKFYFPIIAFFGLLMIYLKYDSLSCFICLPYLK
jgi:hypothetical protein